MDKSTYSTVGTRRACMERDVKHGCCSCTHYNLPTSKEPCKGCVRWSKWEDKDG